MVVFCCVVSFVVAAHGRVFRIIHPVTGLRLAFLAKAKIKVRLGPALAGGVRLRRNGWVRVRFPYNEKSEAPMGSRFC